jgi:small nuclear ribonucleoprotein F
VSIDSYMNIQLSGAEEWIDQQMTSVLGQVLIRYVNTFFVL